ncbi:unnamed protein product [Darwinula stevensoni]|uniref:Uncharacterized protein n=1 Tax=Darwinula stevensoni TaxID=69355 RepID=A0A7R9ADJ1_9CRUS|nr:unnamed protein product [Darwinula stevensoni]CAG0901164.1 unnamed protein product [Darwinula stevensoni]
MTMVSALSGSTERAFYQRTICLANRQGSVISDFNLEFTQGVNLGKVQDDIDANSLLPDGTHQLGELQTDYLPSGRTLTTTTTTGAPDIVMVKSDRVSRLMLQVTLPSVAGDNNPVHSDHPVLHGDGRELLLLLLQRLTTRTVLDLVSFPLLPALSPWDPNQKKRAMFNSDDLFRLWFPRAASMLCGNANIYRRDESDPMDSQTEE